ncbi:HAD family hydrolase [Aeromicrobium sp. CF3.5]|uniref:HAD family hydrolase n=1 Tax=Aeromicrobium sp. CF3.5 TaxID=3373078 RepID=UPI003EE5E070
MTSSSDWRPRLVALDVDGTLVDYDNVMTDPVRESVRALAAAGIEVVISTGRSVPGVLNAADKLDLEGYAVASNGSVVMAYRPLEIVHQVTFDASEAVHRIVERLPDALVAVEEMGVGYRVNKAFPSGEINGTMTVQSVAELVGEPVTRVIIRSPEHDADDFHEIVADLGLGDTNYYVGYTAWLDLAPEGVSKASGLDVLCQRLGLEAADVLAVGDGNNDIEMLRWAGRGVAMGQGPDSVKAAADAVTGPIDADGLVDELRRYL